MMINSRKSSKLNSLVACCSLRQTNGGRCLRICQINHMAPTVEPTRASSQKLLSPSFRETLNSAAYVHAVGSGSRCDKGVAAPRSSPLDPGRSGVRTQTSFGRNVLILFQHLQLYCQSQYGAEHHSSDERRPGPPPLCDRRETGTRLSTNTSAQ